MVGLGFRFGKGPSKPFSDMGFDTFLDGTSGKWVLK